MMSTSLKAAPTAASPDRARNHNPLLDVALKPSEVATVCAGKVCCVTEVGRARLVRAAGVLGARLVIENWGTFQ